MTIVHHLTEQELRAAERAWLRSGLEQLDPNSLGAEIDHWLRHRAMLAGDLQARNFLDTDEAALIAGMEYASLRLAELTRQAERHARAMTFPSYPQAQPQGDLTARFQAARYCDLVGLIETLTGQQATRGGQGRYRVRCPFHDDRTPSLVIYPPGRGWWCPVCHLGGDAVTFVARLKMLPAVEALDLVELLADTTPAVWEGVTR